MRIDDIDALLATVQFSSLNQAAEYLGITQSAITRRLQRLEQTLNVTLLERQTRPLTLTAAGHRVYEQCLSIKRETKKLYGLLDPEAEPHGILRLGVPQSVAEIALQPALTALCQQFPALRPQVTCGWSGLLQISLVAQGLGLGLVPRAALAASPWRDEVTVLTLADFQPEVHLWLVHAQNLANLSQPLTFFAGKVVQQLNVSG